MASKSSKIEWLVGALGDDYNWWAKEVSDPVRWDVDSLSLLDPKQWAYILEMIDPLREYGLNLDAVENAFISLAIDKDLGDNHIRMVSSSESLLESEEVLFALPDVVDDETGPYADFLDKITVARVKYLNDIIDFEQNMTTTELEEELRDELSNLYFESKSLHFFTEITSILEYAPAGYDVEGDTEESDEAATPKSDDEEIIEEVADFEEVTTEVIPTDDTMKWDEDEDEEEDDPEEYLEDGSGPPDPPDAPEIDIPEKK